MESISICHAIFLEDQGCICLKFTCRSWMYYVGDEACVKALAERVDDTGECDFADLPGILAANIARQDLEAEQGNVWR